jgi:hypothetical protein
MIVITTLLNNTLEPIRWCVTTSNPAKTTHLAGKVAKAMHNLQIGNITPSFPKFSMKCVKVANVKIHTE